MVAGPFYNAIKSISSGTPTSTAFTPSTASAGFLAWSTVPTGWWGMVRFEDGSAWELQYGFWNGTTISRSATAQFVSSSTGSALTLTSAATATLVCNGLGIDAKGYVPRAFVAPIPGTTTFSTFGMPALSTVGTLGSVTVSSGGTNAASATPKVRSTSATTANAQASFSSTTTLAGVSASAGAGGYLFSCRFGTSAFPATGRMFIGMTGTTFVANTGEPSAFTASYAVCGRDSTDTNMQFLMNSNVGAGTKIDTGIPFSFNDFFELYIWALPGSLTTYFLLVDQVSGAIFYSSSSADAPANTAGLMPQMICGLSATTGVAFALEFAGMSVHTGLF